MYRKCAESFIADHCGNVNPPESLCCDAFSVFGAKQGQNKH